MPLWDGGDCQTLVTFVYVFTVVGFCFTAGSVIGMCRNGHLLYSVFCLVFGIVISPFILYMLAGIEVAGLLFLLGWAILGLVVLLCSCCCRNQDKKAEKNRTTHQVASCPQYELTLEMFRNKTLIEKRKFIHPDNRKHTKSIGSLVHMYLR